MAVEGEGVRPRASWKQNPEAVRRDILRVATELFARNGLSGTRVDEITARTKTSKRMIYYYFGDKEGLWSHALEAAYTRVREGEQDLDLNGLPPAQALRRLVEFTFDHHRDNPDFIRMVMIENIHHAAYIGRSETIRTANATAIDRLSAILDRGVSEGVFRPGIDPITVHWQISALSFFNVSNRPTFSLLFGDEPFTQEGQRHLRDEAVDMILNNVLMKDASR